jgi:hypothetical protein
VHELSSLGALKADKSEAHDDPLVAAKDRADLATLHAPQLRRMKPDLGEDVSELIDCARTRSPVP